jgi:flagellar biosynthesis/type III secretory pathway protein FliH
MKDLDKIIAVLSFDVQDLIDSKVEEAKKEAFQEGYEKGEEKGYDKGYGEGHEAGKLEVEEEFKKKEKVKFT